MKICFWGNVTDALNGKTPGGGELQIVLLSKALKQLGYEVVIIDPEGKEDFISPEGINIITVKNWNKGIRILRTFTHRLPQFYRLLKQQNADIYYCRIRDFRHIFAYWAAKKVNAKFVLALASDLDILSFRMKCKHSYLTQIAGPWLYVNGLLVEVIYPFLFRKSDMIFTQHEGQTNLLQKKNIHSLIVPNLIDIEIKQTYADSNRNEFIYVGAFDKRKGFIEFFNLVKSCPKCLFRVIGLPRDRTGYKYYEKLKTIDNVILTGWLKHTDTILNIANSKALISTSPMEGFPNIFLESWACGIPVLSLYVNPGSIIEKEDLGYCANGNMEDLIKKVNFYNSNNVLCENGKDYVERIHLLNENRRQEIKKNFEELIKKKNSN